MSLTRLLWWAPLAVLVLVGAAFFLRMGVIAARVSETDVINRYAALYVASTGGELTDCYAVPGQDQVWIVILCGRAHSYPVDKTGALIRTIAGQGA